jgi:hypothetical protein
MYCTRTLKMDDPHDDCTHWAGNIPETYTDILERSYQRVAGRQFKSNTVSEELGLEEKRET